MTDTQPLGDHPHTDPGDGRTECDRCGKYIWPATHSCKGVPVTEAARERLSRRLASDLGEVRVQFWACPVEGHSDRKDAKGWPVVTVEWEGDVARCTANGCGRTSADKEDR